MVPPQQGLTYQDAKSELMVMGPPERVQKGLCWNKAGLGWGQLL